MAHYEMNSDTERFPMSGNGGKNADNWFCHQLAYAALLVENLLPM